MAASVGAKTRLRQTQLRTGRFLTIRTLDGAQTALCSGAVGVGHLTLSSEPRRLAVPTSPEERPKQTWWTAIPTFVKEIAALLTAVAGVIAALAAVGVIGGGDGDGSGTTATNGSTRPLPVVVRLEAFGGSYVERGFFTPKGYIVSTPDVGRGEFTAIWSTEAGEEEARVELVDQGGLVAQGVVLMALAREEPPLRDFETRNTTNMKPGDRVKAFLSPTQSTLGQVVAVGATRLVGNQEFNNLLITTRVTRPGEGGLPLMDAEDRVVGMLFADDRANRQSASVPIEDIRTQFADAF
jgi:hypothetical protein